VDRVLDRALEAVRVACFWVFMALLAAFAAMLLLGLAVLVCIGLLLQYVVEFLTPRGERYR
jgi:hypothetical protein